MSHRSRAETVYFEAIAAEMSAIAHGSRILQHRQFISFFGVSATCSAMAWSIRQRAALAISRIGEPPRGVRALLSR